MYNAWEVVKSSCAVICANLHSFAEIVAVITVGSMVKSGPSMGDEERASRFMPFSGGR